ncbi:MAG: hypothetical protein U0X39_04710 [Bacteroidales bacterium]
MENEIRTVQKKILPKFISVLFHPVFMPVYGLLVIFTAPTVFWYLPLVVKKWLFVVYMILDVIVPLSLMPFLVHRKIISSWQMENREDRILPLILLTVFYVSTSVLIHRWQIPFFLKAYTYSLPAISFVLLLVTLKWKISLHAAGAGALTALVIILSLRMSTALTWYLSGVLLLSGIILSSRLRLDAHAPSEVYTGYSTGFVVSFIFMLLLQ